MKTQPLAKALALNNMAHAWISTINHFFLCSITLQEDPTEPQVAGCAVAMPGSKSLCHMATGRLLG